MLTLTSRPHLRNSVANSIAITLTRPLDYYPWLYANTNHTMLQPGQSTMIRLDPIRPKRKIRGNAGNACIDLLRTYAMETDKATIQALRSY